MWEFWALQCLFVLEDRLQHNLNTECCGLGKFWELYVHPLACSHLVHVTHLDACQSQGWWDGKIYFWIRDAPKVQNHKDYKALKSMVGKIWRKMYQSTVNIDLISDESNWCMFQWSWYSVNLCTDNCCQWSWLLSNLLRVRYSENL